MEINVQWSFGMSGQSVSKDSVGGYSGTIIFLDMERCSGSNDVWTIGIQQGYSGSTDELE